MGTYTVGGTPDSARMDEKEQIIPYRSVPRWVAPVAGGSCLVAAVAIVFMTTSLAALIQPGLPHATLIVVETFLRAVGVLLCLVFAFLSYELARNDHLSIGKNSINLPLFMAPAMLFRLRRSWGDVANVCIGAMLRQDKKGYYEYELESTSHKRMLFIYFKSGGHAAIDLTKIPRKTEEIIFKAIEPYCLTTSRTPSGKLARSKRKQGANQEAAPPATYTQLWEDELQAHFSATNFVPLEKGDKLQSGKIEVLMQLASGGLSAVYLGETPNDELIIVKECVLPPGLSEQTAQKAREMFRRESAILRQLDHPRIAKVLDFFNERGRDYLSIEFVPGDNLRQIVKKRGVQSERVVLSIAKLVAEILDYLHAQTPPVVHRDITPDNLLLKESGNVVLIDFGAANQFVGTATGTLVGKQCYIAPEQFRGKSTIQTDFYGLGCTLYFLLTGCDPEALSTSRPREKRADVSEELDSLVRDLTATMLENRVSSTEELLRRIARTMPDTVLPLPASEVC
ncbi:MAG TPA: serine/threonine-protein kinase [Planktothrix sp.]